MDHKNPHENSFCQHFRIEKGETLSGISFATKKDDKNKIKFLYENGVLIF